MGYFVPSCLIVSLYEDVNIYDVRNHRSLKQLLDVIARSSHRQRLLLSSLFQPRLGNWRFFFINETRCWRCNELFMEAIGRRGRQFSDSPLPLWLLPYVYYQFENSAILRTGSLNFVSALENSRRYWFNWSLLSIVQRTLTVVISKRRMWHARRSNFDLKIVNSDPRNFVCQLCFIEF